MGLGASKRVTTGNSGATGPDVSGPFDPFGDYNLVGFRRQLESIRDGVFVDPSHGANFAPGRGEGSLRDPPLRHTDRRMAYTWRRASSWSNRDK